MKHLLEDIKRKDLFEYYNGKDNPFSFITTKIEITNIYNYSLKHKHLYATLGYIFTKCLNKIENFKFSYEDGKFYKYDLLCPNFTQKLDNGDVSFIEFDYVDDLRDFIKKYDLVVKDFKDSQSTVMKKSLDNGVVWFSCLPWFKFSGVIPPYDKSITIPQLIWDKYEKEGKHVYVNLMIMAHHGFVDGSHIALLIDYINDEISNFKEV